MGSEAIGIIVENEDKDILYHDNSFIIDVDITSKNITNIIDVKLEEVLNKKAFRIDRIYKKMPKLALTKEGINTEDKVIYLVSVYMYSDNSDFKDKEYVLGSITNPLYKEYFVKYIIRYDKYKKLVESYCSLVFLIFYLGIYFDSTVGTIITPPLLDNFILYMFVYMVIPYATIYKIIMPGILKHLINYDISKKAFKINKFIIFLMQFTYIIMLIFLFSSM